MTREEHWSVMVYRGGETERQRDREGETERERERINQAE